LKKSWDIPPEKEKKPVQIVDEQVQTPTPSSRGTREDLRLIKRQAKQEERERKKTSTKASTNGASNQATN
jgi:hypothetical protein